MTSRFFTPWMPAIVGAMLCAGGLAYGAPNPVLYWNDLGTRISAEVGTDPIHETRLCAMLQLAVHDAVNAIEPRYQAYGSGVPAAPGASVDAAVAQASHDVLVQLLPARAADIDAALKAALAAVADGSAKSRGIATGREAAARILSSRRSDGADREAAYKPGTKAGQYRPTPPDFTPAFLPQWGAVRPFALTAGDQFRPSAPLDPAGDRARFEVSELAMMGGAEAPARTAEQSEMARFWYEWSTQGWNRIARTVAQDRQLDACESARLLALVNMAMADGMIAALEAKYHYAYWRPATAVRDAGHAEWVSYLPTPPIPDYPSGHATLGASAAAVLTRYFGCDYVSFSTTSGAPYAGITRKFWSFSEAAQENAASRVFAGLHFPTAVASGLQMGDTVGAWTFDHALRPLQPGPMAASGASMR